MTSFTRRLLAGTAAATLVLAPSAALAQDPSAPTPPEAAADWLVDQLTDGTHLTQSFGDQTFVNYGPTADVALGLLMTGQQTDTREDVVDFLSTEESVDAYVHGGSDQDTYAGAAAKLGFLTTVAGRDARDVGGEDLVATLLGLEGDDGRFRDDINSFPGEFSNVLGQSFALMFLTATDDVAPSDASVQYLMDAACPDGGFPQDFEQDTCTSQADATGLAIQALRLAAPDASAAHVDEAVQWLFDTRDDDGAWGGAAGDQNVNSTAYAGMGLTAAGQDAQSSRDFLVAAQNDDGGLPITPGDPSDPIATAQALPLLAGTTLVAPVVERIAGDTRQGTAIDVSRASFADGAAKAVVLSRDDLFADALAGTPLAVKADGPLLTTSPTGLADDVLAEIQRVLPEGRQVLVLGGPHALPASVDEDLEAAGYTTRRIAGETRFHTSVEIAAALGDPQLQLLTTGRDFPDALTAGTAAAANDGAVLLTDHTTPHEAVAAYLEAHDGDQVAVGGPAAEAHPDARPLVGADRDTTAVLVAEEFFDGPTVVGLARRDLFADALAGGALMARTGGPLVLTATTSVPEVTGDLLCDLGPQLRRTTVFGGPVAISDEVVATVRERVAGTGC